MVKSRISGAMPIFSLRMISPENPLSSRYLRAPLALFRMHKDMMVEIGHILMDPDELHFTVVGDLLGGRDLDTERFPEFADSLCKRYVLNFHVELQDIAALLAPETVAYLLIRTDGERRRLFIVEWTETDIVPSPLFQFYITGNKVSDVGPLFNCFYCFIWYSHSHHPLMSGLPST